MTEEKKEVPLHRERLNLPDKEEQQKLTEAKRKQLRSDMSLVFGTVEGRRVLRHLMEACGFRRGKIGGNPQIGMDIHAGLLYNCAREQVFIELTEFIRADILRDAEFGVSEDLES
jgi:hypothetical protein